MTVSHLFRTLYFPARMFKLSQLFSCPVSSIMCAGSGALRGRMRARDGDEKQARREAILDAAAQLFSARHELVNVADIAVAAGLAKGTVYLYFQSKEEIYLALHMRHVEQFFQPLLARVALAQPIAISELMGLVDEHVLGNNEYLPLGASCTGFAEGAVTAEAMAQFQSRLTEFLTRSGAGLERHLPGIPKGEGTRLLYHSYALMVGLYSLMRDANGSKCGLHAGMGSFRDEVRQALQRYWANATENHTQATAKIQGQN